MKITIRNDFKNFENKKQILAISGNLLPITILGGAFPPTPNTPYYYPGGCFYTNTLNKPNLT